MSAKRPPQYEIDPKTLEHIEKPISSQNVNNETKDRKILKVKKDEEGIPIVKNIVQGENKETQNHESNKKQEKKQLTDKPKEIPQKKQQKKQAPLLFKGLFENKSQTDHGKGLFSSTINTTQSSSLFGVSSASLFNTSTKVNFNNKSTSLFSNNGENANKSSIFNFGSSAPPLKKDEEKQDEEGDGDSADLQAAQVDNTDPLKSEGKYEYKEELKMLVKGKAHKYKRNNGDLLQNVEIMLQDDTQNKQFIITVRLIATKHNIFAGFIFEGKSSVRILNKKKQNLQISVFSVNKSNQRLEKSYLKLQFQSADLGSEFYNSIENIVKGEGNQAKNKQKNQAPEKQQN